MPTIHLDLETRSTVDLKKVGIFVYASDPTTEVWCACYAVDDGPVQTWTPGEPCPEVVAQAILEDWVFMAHNAQFEATLWAGVLAPRYGWPPPGHRQWRCTMAMALAMALPGHLEGAAAAAGLDNAKDAAGSRLMMQMCKPRSVTDPSKGLDLGQPAITWWDTPDRVDRLIEYCRQDVELERELSKRIRPLSQKEQALWQLDQAINRRGVTVDVELALAAQPIIDTAMARLNVEMKRITDGEVQACSNTGQLSAWLRSKGYSDVASVDKAALGDFYIYQEHRGGPVARAIQLRQEAGMSSTAKLRAMVAVAGEDGRARGLFRFHKATTGRWAGALIQVQNMPRGKMTPRSLAGAMELIAAGDIDGLDMIYGPPLQVISSCLRGFIRAAPGHELITADFSAIEARAVAWLAGEEWVLDVFRGDGKIYEHAAAGIYNVPKAQVTKDQRFIGKISVLALGYQGGVGAFQAMARAYGLDLPDDRADEIKLAWRKANPNIVQFWYAVERAAVAAVRSPGEVFRTGKVMFKQSGSFLFARLPSSRLICYPYPSVEKEMMTWGQEKDCLYFRGEDAITHAWTQLKTYGGRLVENIVQAVARDLLAEAMLRLEDAGYPVVMHIHDEVVCEVPEGTGDLKKFEGVMASVPGWAAGLPMAVEGWIGSRYRK